MKTPCKNGWEFQSDCPVPNATLYRKELLSAIVEKHAETGLLHLSLSHPYRIPSYGEIKDARYSLLPDNIHMAQIFPPQDEFVNTHRYCLHLFQLDNVEIANVRQHAAEPQEANVRQHAAEPQEATPDNFTVKSYAVTAIDTVVCKAVVTCLTTCGRLFVCYVAQLGDMADTTTWREINPTGKE